MSILHSLIIFENKKVVFVGASEDFDQMLNSAFTGHNLNKIKSSVDVGDLTYYGRDTATVGGNDYILLYDKVNVHG